MIITRYNPISKNWEAVDTDTGEVLYQSPNKRDVLEWKLWYVFKND